MDTEKIIKNYIMEEIFNEYPNQEAFDFFMNADVDATEGVNDSPLCSKYGYTISQQYELDNIRCIRGTMQSMYDNLEKLVVKLKIPEKKSDAKQKNTFSFKCYDKMFYANAKLQSISIEDFKDRLSKADCISINGSPLLTYWDSNLDVIVDTKWNEDDLEFSCKYEVEDVITISYNPKSSVYTVHTDNEKSNFELYSLSKLGEEL